MRLKKLSELRSSKINNIINELLDEGYDGIINDMTSPPNIEYMLDELLIMGEWINQLNNKNECEFNR